MNATLPGKLYKYCPFSTQSLRLLTAAEAYYADPRRFNDPLDCNQTIKIDVDVRSLEHIFYKCLRRTKEHDKATAAISELRYLSTEDFDDINDPARTKYLERLLARRIEELLEDELGGKGVLSLSAVWDSPLMWSHYADQHRGLCIEYDTTEISHPNIGAVNYEASRGIKASDLVRWKLEGCQDAQKRVHLRIFLAKRLNGNMKRNGRYRSDQWCIPIAISRFWRSFWVSM